MWLSLQGPVGALSPHQSAAISAVPKLADWWYSVDTHRFLSTNRTHIISLICDKVKESSADEMLSRKLNRGASCHRQLMRQRGHRSRCCSLMWHCFFSFCIKNVFVWLINKNSFSSTYCTLRLFPLMFIFYCCRQTLYYQSKVKRGYFGWMEDYLSPNSLLSWET